MEKEKSNLKTVYIIIIVLLLLFFFLFAYFNRKNIIKSNSSEKEYDTVIIAGNVVFQKTNNHWNTVSSKSNILKKVNWKKYNIYLDYNYFGKYNLVYSDGWFAFDDDRKGIDISNYNNSFFAYKSEDVFDIKKIEIKEITSLSINKKILKEFNININNNPNSSIYTELDLDGDNSKERIYAINNVIPEIEGDPAFSLFAIEKDNKLYQLYKAGETESNGSLCFPTINSVLDIDEDKNYEVIMSCTNTGVDSIKTVLYKYDEEKDDYEIVISD